jgi:SAM-dependent methyltransferase
MQRRTLFSMTGATALAAAMRPLAAGAKAAVPLDFRGMDGQLRRLPKLDAASNQEFLAEFRTWVQRAPDGLMRVARTRALEVLKEHGYKPTAELPVKQIAEMMGADSAMAAGCRAWLATQSLTWAGVKQLFDANRDACLAELRAAEKAGPGSLELNPTMHIPDYAKHEIHIMPGGYVGDPLAGYILHYGGNAFHMGHNNQDQVQSAFVAAAPTPTKGKVRRILEIGCACGQTTVALKRRFPDAEVWGIDVGGPMVHYAHMRATQLGVNVNFQQALAEATGFPDNYFDMVVSRTILHEVPNVKNTEIMKEISRLLRSGGTYYPQDFYTSQAPPKNAYGRFWRWWDHRWNNEVWALEHMHYDLPGDLERFGMAVTLDGPGASLMLGSGRRPRPNLFATKRA